MDIEKIQIDKILEVLQIPDETELNKRLDLISGDFTYAEKLFILLYTSPLSKLAGNGSRCAVLLGYCRKNWAYWFLHKDKTKELIRNLQNQNTINELEEFFRDDIKRNLDIITLNRSDFREDKEYTDKENDITYENITDKPLYKLNKKQRAAIKDFTYDKIGNAHYVIESRTEARANLMNYYKLLNSNKTDENSDNKTVVTLDLIKDKVTAKIEVIKKNEQEALDAGEFIKPQKDVDEED